jgi:hypothetical protein
METATEQALYSDPSTQDRIYGLPDIGYENVTPRGFSGVLEDIWNWAPGKAKLESDIEQWGQEGKLGPWAAPPGETIYFDLTPNKGVDEGTSLGSSVGSALLNFLIPGVGASETIPGQIGPTLAQTGMEPYAGSTPVSQALQGIFPEGAPTSLMEEGQPPRSLPIGTPGWQPDIPAQTISPDWNLRDRMSQMYERAFIDPDEYGWTRPTIEQRQEAIRGVQGAPEGFWGALQDRIANLIPGAEASIARDVEFEREQREPTWFPPTTSSGIGGMIEEPASSPFIGDETFVPSLPARTLGGPVVGEKKEEVSEKRVKEIKKKPKEKRTSVEEQVVVASEVQKALSNAAKGKPVKQELKAIVELAKVDPTIVARYTTPGSQALQDITAQVDSFSFMPTIQKKKKPVPGYGLPPTRPGGR